MSRQEGMVPRAARRLLDMAAAGLALLVCAPLCLPLAVWIRLDSPGPVFFRQERLGLDRRPFALLKFRSMRTGGSDSAHRALIAAELAGTDTRQGGSTKLADDPRVTRSGRFLRRTSLDELPQLWNVLRGDMTLVGPRPGLAWEAALFPARYAGRFDVRPGMTGLWQVWGRSTIGTLGMLELDLAYVRNRSLRRDLALLIATGPALLRGQGAR